MQAKNVTTVDTLTAVYPVLLVTDGQSPFYCSVILHNLSTL